MKYTIWKMTTEQFNRIMDSLNKIYFKEFFFPPLQYITILVWIFMLFNIKKIAPFYGYLLIVLPLGFAAILVLWFQVLEGHDYYMITQMQVLVIVWAVFFSYLKNKKPFNHPATYILLLAAFVLLANNGRKRQNERFQGWMNENYFLHFEALTEIEPCFEKWNIKPDDKVISLPDFAINTSLYYMNRKGYTEFGSDYLSEETIKKRIYQGAKYLVLNDTSILRQPAIQKFATNFVGQYRNVRVYKINPGLVDSIQSASSNSGSRPQDIYHVSKNEIVIINNLEETLSKNSSWKGEITVFNKKKMAHSGNYVCITNDTLEYSYTYNELFKNINDRVPKSVIFRGWIYTTLANPKISIICGLNNNGKQYYWNAYPLEQVLTETGKWVEFTSSFYFDNKTIDLNDDIALYAWNQSKKPIYIDDLKISFIY